MPGPGTCLAFPHSELTQGGGGLEGKGPSSWPTLCQPHLGVPGAQGLCSSDQKCPSPAPLSQERAVPQVWDHTEWLRLREDSVPFEPSLKWQREQLLQAGVSEGHGEQLELTQQLGPPPPDPPRCARRGRAAGARTGGGGSGPHSPSEVWPLPRPGQPQPRGLVFCECRRGQQGREALPFM